MRKLGFILVLLGLSSFANAGVMSTSFGVSANIVHDCENLTEDNKEFCLNTPTGIPQLVEHCKVLEGKQEEACPQVRIKLTGDVLDIDY